MKRTTDNSQPVSYSRESYIWDFHHLSVRFLFCFKHVASRKKKQHANMLSLRSYWVIHNLPMWATR